jgi:hypothetical protein
MPTRSNRHAPEDDIGFPASRQDLIKGDHIHFDNRQYNFIDWTDEADLKKRPRDRIGATLGQGPLPPN